MRFENRFEVAAPLEEVWDAVLDVERVAPNVPGAQVLEKTGDNAYKVAIKVKVGPMSMTYRGDVEVTERDEAAHRAVMKARAKESRGQGTADADVTMTLSGDDARTTAEIVTEVDLTGKVATMGQGVLQDVSGRLVDAFAENLAAMLEGREEEPAAPPPGTPGPGAPAGAGVGAEAPPPPPREPAEALDLGSIGGAVIADRLKDPRHLGVVLAIVAIVAYLLGRRRGRRGR
ncbi:MAG TPA: SRPBCC family protein [Capillimicrobium sp.]|nr:SRPBCC family protein [Capillimicrobium sp.]